MAVSIAPVAAADAGASPPPPASTRANPYDAEGWVPVAEEDPQLGSTTALVTLVELGDYQCPYTQRVQETLAKLRESYGPDQLRIVWKNEPLPFHEKAHDAAEIGAGVHALAGDEVYWRFHEAVFKDQQHLEPESLFTHAQQAGVTDMTALRQGFTAHTWAGKVERDHDLAKTSGVNGTPAFLVDGEALSGAQPFEKFKTVIDRQLAAAQAKLAAGTPRERLYAVVSSEYHREHPTPVAASEKPSHTDDWVTVHKVPVGSSPVRGKSDALVTMIELSDYQCPYCRREEAVITELRAAYGDKLRIVWKDNPLPFHDRAEPAAELALEALAQKGSAGFWKVHDELLASEHLTDDDLMAIAEKEGLTRARTAAAITEHLHKRQLAADKELAVDFEAGGTPTFFINGRRIVGAQPLETMKKIIDEEVIHAAEVRKKGVAPARLYAALIKDGRGPAQPDKKTVTANAHAPSRGNAHAKVVVEEFADFQCPFCARAEPTLEALRKTYGSRVRFVWRNLPLAFHPHAELAAEVAAEAHAQKGDAGFWTMHDALFADGKIRDDLSRPALEQLADSQGLDMTKLRAALDAHTHQPGIAADAKAAADASITGTPGFVINGYFVNGAQPEEKFQRVIDRALKEAK